MARHNPDLELGQSRRKKNLEALAFKIANYIPEFSIWTTFTKIGRQDREIFAFFCQIFEISVGILRHNLP